MINIPHFIINYLSPFIAFITGLYAYKHMSLFWRLLFWQVGIYLVNIALSYMITLSQPDHKDNSSLYNIYIPVEATFLFMAGFFYFKDRLKKCIVLIFYFFFISMCAVVILLYDINKFYNYVVVIESIFTTLVYGLILYCLFSEKHNALEKRSVLWASLGLVIYSACIIPYMSCFFYLKEHCPLIFKSLFNHIVDVLANIRYFFLAYAFWLLARRAKQNPVIVNG